MSRSSNIVENPTVKYLDWNSENGEFSYYDKDDKAKIPVKLPFRFLVLDSLTTVKGYSEKYESGIWSNEIRNLKDEDLVVRTSKGVLTQGKYADIKDEVASAGGKYTKSLYIVVGEEIWNIQLKGAAFSGWLEFEKQAKRKIFTDAVVCTSFKSEKKGRVNYTVPLFSVEAISEEENEFGKNLDRVLQDYLTFYLKKAAPVAPASTEPADGEY